MIRHRALRTILALTFCCAIIGACISAWSAGEDNAGGADLPIVIEQFKGNVSVLRVDTGQWVTPDEDGFELNPGDVVRTDSGGRAIISFGDEGYVALLPMTDILVDATRSPEGDTVGVGVMETGRAWVRMTAEEGDSQLILVTKNSVVNGKQASVFVESDRESCMDVFQGDIGVRPRGDLTKVISLSENHRALIESELGDMQMATVGREYDEANPNYTCMLIDRGTGEVVASQVSQDTQVEAASTAESGGAETTTATETTEETSSSSQESGTPEVETTMDVEEEEDSYVVELTVSTSLTFTAPEAQEEEQQDVASAAAAEESSQPEQPESRQQDYGDSEDFVEDDDVFGDSSEEYEESASQADSTYSADVSDYEEEDEEVVYEEIEVTVSSEIVFVSAPAQKCKIPPIITKLFADKVEVFNEDAVMIKSETDCGTEADLLITWQVKPVCGGIVAMSMTDDIKKTNFAGGDIGVTIQGKHQFKIEDEDERSFKIEAKDSEGNLSSLSYTVTVMEPEKLNLPQLKNILVDGEDIKNGMTYELDNDFCEPYTMDIEGLATSKCGEIISVKVKAHETDLIVDGTDEWSTYINLKQPQIIPVIVEAKDSAGLTSRPFVFTLDFDKEVTTPEVTIESVGGFEPEGNLGEITELYKNDLVGGKLMVMGSAESETCSIKKVEISLNGGSSWSAVQGYSGWSYSFTPREGSYEITGRAFDLDQNESDEMLAPMEIYYWNKTIEQVIQESFENIVRAYQDRDSETILENTSSNFSSDYDSIESHSNLDDALSGRFNDISDVYLRYRVESVVATGRTGGRVIFSWDANPNSSGYSHTGTFAFQRESDGWHMIAIEDNNTFLRYTDEADSISLSAEKTTLIADNYDTTEITATVRDSAYNMVKNGTTVNFTTTNGDIDASTTTDDGQAVVTFTASDIISNATITCTSGGVSSQMVLTIIRETAPTPPAAYVACQGASDGDSCSYTTPGSGDPVSGSCTMTSTLLACISD